MDRFAARLAILLLAGSLLLPGHAGAGEDPQPPISRREVRSPGSPAATDSATFSVVGAVQASQGFVLPDGSTLTQKPVLQTGGGGCTAAGSVVTQVCAIPGTWDYCALTNVNPQFLPRSSNCTLNGSQGGSWSLEAYSGFDTGSGTPTVVCNALCLSLVVQ